MLRAENPLEGRQDLDEDGPRLAIASARFEDRRERAAVRRCLELPSAHPRTVPRAGRDSVERATAEHPVLAAATYPAATNPVAYWSTEARCAIVPASAGPENFGNKFPGDAAVYMGIVHVAIYDATLAGGAGHQPHGTLPAAAIATAANDTLAGLQPTLGLTAGGQATLTADYAAYLAALPNGPGKTAGPRSESSSPEPCSRGA